MSKKHGTLLLVDFANQFYKGRDIFGGLTFGGKETGGLYGFVSLFASILKNVRPSDVVVCGDHPPYIRKMLFPAYKEGRVRDDDERYRVMWENQEWSKQFLSILGFPYWTVEGFEADDLVAVLVNRYASRYERIVIASTDSDLYQLLDRGNVFMYLGKRSKGTNPYWGLQEFRGRFQDIVPSDWPLVTAMSGGHNNMDKIKGMGVVNASKALKDPEKFKQVMAQHGEMVEENLRLCTLPLDYHMTQEVLRPASIKRSSWDERELMSFFQKFGIEMTKSMLYAFNGV